MNCSLNVNIKHIFFIILLVIFIAITHLIFEHVFLDETISRESIINSSENL